MLFIKEAGTKISLLAGTHKKHQVKQFSSGKEDRLPSDGKCNPVTPLPKSERGGEARGGRQVPTETPPLWRMESVGEHGCSTG